jgi:aryl-phospho-beta-D-glucosidase BglC (GH1 family)
MNCTLTVYQLKSFKNDSDWEAAWKFVDLNYGNQAICRDVFTIDMPHEALSQRLTAALSVRDDFFNFLSSEIEEGATHVFVHPLPQSKPVFGLQLSQLM